MSTTIYDAYEFNGTQEELLKFCKELRISWTNYFLKERIENALGIDRGKIAISKEEIHKVIDEFKEQTKKPHNMMWDTLDFKASVVIYPFEGRLFAQFFLDGDFGRDVVDPLMKDDGRFRDYHYQNQTDPWYSFEEFTEDQTKEYEADWKERERVWDSIFESPVEYESESPISMMFGSMKDAGFIYEIGSASDIGSLEYVMGQRYRKFVIKSE